MPPRDFLLLAGELSPRNTEACWRSAASRAYYAAFHVARDFLNSLGFAIRQGDQSHAAVYRRLSNTRVPDVDDVGNRLIDLRRLRNQADYDLHRSFAAADARKAIQAAERLFDIVNAQRDQQALASLATNIRTYERDVLRDITWRQS